MKKLLVSFLVLGLANFCVAQTAAKNSEIKFTPPVIKKNKQVRKTTHVSTVKFTPPVIENDDEVTFTPPVIKKNKATKKTQTVKFTPPVIVKDN